ncbi:MAG: class I SAM-dependent methyltransferase [Deltaproteobacteria bacterium]|nr:class I SAM-dependent methyltransferase [Deltaproteobacteria bacterium]
MPDRDWWQALWPDPKRVLEDIGVVAGMHVVDLCCGDGYFTAPLGQLVADGTVLAVELSADMMAAAHTEVEVATLGNVTFIQDDAMKLAELVPDPVDLVLIANTFHGAPDHTGLARAVRATLRGDGVFVVINWGPRPREETGVLGKPRGPRFELRFSPEQVAAWVEPAGFRLREVKEVGPYHYGAVFDVAIGRDQ